MEVTETTARVGPRFRGRWLWLTLAVLLGLAIMLRLGFWQLERLDQRRAENALLRARLSEPAVTLTGQPVDPAALDLRRGVVRGSYDPAQEVVLRNQALGGAPGAHLITPLRVSGSDVAVMVDRGWIPYDRAGTGARAAFAPPAGEIEVRGLLRRGQTRLNSISPADPPLGPERPRLDEWFRVDVERIQEQVPYALLPVYLEAGEPSLDAEGSRPDALTLPAPAIAIDLSDGPHLSYAFQWFAFAAILGVGYVALYLREVRRV